MKNIYYLLSTLTLLFFSASLISQDNNKQGVITMEITEVDSDDQQLATQLQMMIGSETIYHYNEEKSLVINSMMGGMILFQKMTQNNNGDVLLLIDAMGNKTIIESTKEEREKLSDKSASSDHDLIIKYDETDTKDILGYKCIKATINSEDSSFGFEMYIAPDLNVSNKIVQRLESLDIKGFPLEYTIDLENLSMTYKAVDIETTLDDNVFNLNKKGYEKKSMEEFEKEMSSLGNAGF